MVQAAISKDSLHTYNPQTQQWSLYWANGKDGTIVPPQIGQFKDGRGEFYGQDTLNGKLIYVRTPTRVCPTLSSRSRTTEARPGK